MAENAASVVIEKDLGKSGLKGISRMLCLSGMDLQKSASCLSGVNATGPAEQPVEFCAGAYPELVAQHN